MILSTRIIDFSSTASSELLPSALIATTHVIYLTSLKHFNPLKNDSRELSSNIVHLHETLRAIKRAKAKPQIHVLLTHFDSFVERMETTSPMAKVLVDQFLGQEVVSVKKQIELVCPCIESTPIDLLDTIQVSNYLHKMMAW